MDNNANALGRRIQVLRESNMMTRADLAQHMGVTRKEIVDWEEGRALPTAEQVVLGDFRRISDYLQIGAQDYVCVMTRGHAFDTVVQAQVLRCHPCYCGVIGSRHKAAGVRKVLQEEYGLTDAELDLVTTPIGLDIQAETPAEIAISIAAQMLQHRANRNRQ